MIDRKTYLEMCQKCAVLPNRILGIKENVPNELKVIHEDIEYYPLSLDISFNSKGETINSAVIHSLVANSVMRVNLKDCERFEY